MSNMYRFLTFWKKRGKLYFIKGKAIATSPPFISTAPEFYNETIKGDAEKLLSDPRWLAIAKEKDKIND